MTEVLPNDNIPSQIVPMILTRTRDELKQKLIYGVPDDNPTRAILVKVGRFQENPVDINVSASVASGDFEDPSYIDGRVDHEDLDAIGLRNLPVGEIGGGWYWWRRFTINVQVFSVRQNYEEERAMQYAYDFYGRLLKSIEEITLGGLTDDYGEKANGSPYIEGASFYESGGKGKFIWRGKVAFRVLTWRP